jgi:hypothetical protein
MPDERELSATVLDQAHRPPDFRTINLESAGQPARLDIVAYRGGGVWLTFLPAMLIIVLTGIASVTMMQLRRHAHHRADTEEQCAPPTPFARPCPNR